MRVTNSIIDDLLGCKDESFIDMILTHIRDAIPFEVEDIQKWEDVEV